MEVSYYPYYDIRDFGIKYADLNELMEQDGNFFKEDYFINILDALYEDGKLYYMPLNAEPLYYSIKHQFKDAADLSFGVRDTMNLRQMLDIYARIPSNEVLYLVDNPNIQPNYVTLAYDLLTLKPEERTMFDITPQNEGILRHLFKIPIMDNMTINKLKYGEINGLVNSVFSRYIGTLINSERGRFFDYPGSVYTSQIGVAAEDGKGYFTIYDRLIINEACENKALAWEFAKFCASNPPITPTYTEQSYRSYSYSINRKGFATD